MHKEWHVKVSFDKFSAFDRSVHWFKLFIPPNPFDKVKWVLEHLEDDKLMGSLQKEQYDLGITEQINFCGYAIFNRIGLNNYITAMAFNLLEVTSDFFGVSSNPSYVPGLFLYILPSWYFQ